MKKSVKVILICAASVLIAYAAIWSILRKIMPDIWWEKLQA